MPAIARRFCVDDTQRDRLTGGSAWWYRQTSTYHYGGDAAQSGEDVNDLEESLMQTTVNVQTEGSVSFWWKVSWGAEGQSPISE